MGIEKVKMTQFILLSLKLTHPHQLTQLFMAIFTFPVIESQLHRQQKRVFFT
jgi:hypothetical protein